MQHHFTSQRNWLTEKLEQWWTNKALAHSWENKWARAGSPWPQPEAETQPLPDGRISQRQAGLGAIPRNAFPSSLTSKSLMWDKGAHTRGNGLQDLKIWPQFKCHRTCWLCSFHLVWGVGRTMVTFPNANVIMVSSAKIWKWREWPSGELSLP